ncbi:MAG: YncE family protein [Gemmatimonadota bacterium]|nr:YncE family protein [Gemmatimonadota bacterium]MDQ8147590.1 YncE family protein [Gemmatimonadota bacterium]MDQ8157106.1 YncE family protein [Gemmatimonadota bacterium]
MIARAGGRLGGGLACALGLLAGPGVAAQQAPAPPTREYIATVVSESVDEVARVVFGPSGARVERTTAVGLSLIDPDGPHGVAVTPDQRHYVVTTAHGLPGGSVWKFTADRDTPVGRAVLGNFPATVQVSPDGFYAWAVNFNLHGEMVPSSVSAVALDEMVEVARIPTCTMPHGSRLNADGTRHYSACMMDDLLVEIDTRAFTVARHFTLAPGQERGMAGAPPQRGADAHAGHDMGGHGMTPPAPGDVGCSPTWAQPAPDGRRVWVACNKSSELIEIDLAAWQLVRRIPAGAGIYNLAMTSDGTRVIATNKRGQSVSVFDAASGRELARIPTSKRVVHGVAVTADDRYAFVTNEGVGSEKSTVDIIDLRTLARVASVEVGQQAGGVDVWR